MENLKTAAEKKVRECSYPASADTYLKKIRKNLFGLLCQSDFAEAGADVDLFGGKEAVGDAIAKAVLNLYCLGEVLGADVKSAVQNEIKKTLGNAVLKDVPTDAATEEKPSPQLQPVPGEKTNPGDSLPPKEKYKAEFASAKTSGDVSRILKAAFADKALSGTDRYELQNNHREALERLKSQ